jgi:hypothetical protein
MQHGDKSFLIAQFDYLYGNTLVSAVPTRLETEIKNVIGHVGDRGGTVVKLLRYKSEGRWFDSRWCHWNFSLT